MNKTIRDLKVNLLLLGEHEYIEVIKKMESTLEYVKKNLDNHFNIQGLDVEAIEYMKAVSKKIDDVLKK